MAGVKQPEAYSFAFFVLTFLSFVVVWTVAKHLVRADAAMGLGVCTGMVMIAARTRWDLKAKWWFWAALVFSGALQVPFILFLPWNRPQLTGAGAMLFAVPAFLVALGCVFLVEKAFASSTCSD